jgi:cellobiose phosphorylase
VLAIALAGTALDAVSLAKSYLTESAFDALLDEVRAYWKGKLDTVSFGSGDPNYNLWMKWVTLQPILRRLYGNSFLPHHDYGRGGRGWRDLWQDCLALLLMEPGEVRHLLHNNFAGVRIDGSNATIIGSRPGEFIADRNNIPRVWMDHGAWPLAATLFYLNQTGDLDFLFQEQAYFKDLFISRCRERDTGWHPEDGHRLLTLTGDEYSGSILEHILVQNLVPFYNVGEHNNIKLEGADWNDGMDMGSLKGESVAFTAFYAGNLLELSKLLLHLKESAGRNTIELAEEMIVLFDTLTDPVDYGSVTGKHDLLDRYYRAVAGRISGRKVRVDSARAAADLAAKAEWMTAHLRTNEWIRSSDGNEWFNGYYNNDGERVEGDTDCGVRMTLTGQVFSIMCGVASDEQVRKISASVDRYLKDPKIGYRLNTKFGGIQQNLGRAFGFAFGHKENGAMFSHMTVMYANALYKRGFVREGRAVLDSIYRLSTDFERSRIYPGIPEYINEKGRGMYHYLTGSASWLLLTVLTEVFGVKGRLGDLLLNPRLMADQFDSEQQTASVVTLFAGRRLRVVYRNPGLREYGAYSIQSVKVNGIPADARISGGEAVLSRGGIIALTGTEDDLIEVTLV